jgi:para-aminobenzoate synthetase/4-amino-4-deoxychorismate lyase
MDKQASRDLEAVMEFDPEEGIADLDSHLDRLKNEVAALGYDFDRHAARNELQAATFGKRQPAIARLLVSARGSLAIEIRPE